MTTYEISADNIVIVGCGGVASWLLPVLIRLAAASENRQPNIILVDGDKLEEKNLDRQLFSMDQIGQPKTAALKALYESQYPKLVSLPEYMLEGMDWPSHSLFFGCVDNHVARKLILQAVDSTHGRGIIGGNEYTDSEAYVYEPEWRGTPLDPRVYYPEILTNQANDPTRPQSCQGALADENPQLVIANFSAANHMAWLFWFYYVQRHGMDKAATHEFWPVLHRNTFSRFSTELLGKKRETKPRTSVTA